MALSDDLARALSTLSDQLASILDEGDIDDRSRERLARIVRWSSECAACVTPQPLLELPADSDEAWYRSWQDHVGAIPTVVNPIATPWLTPLAEARLVWLDELDAMSDQELLTLRGLGPKTLAKLRAVLDTYYWRTGRAGGHELWIGILAGLQGVAGLGHIDAARRLRVDCGIEFAERVLAEDGAPLADPTAPRMIP